MGRLIVPQRGQPLDVSYVYDIVAAVNELADRLSSSGNGTFKIISETGESSGGSINTMTVFAKTHVLGTSKTVTAGQQEAFSITYNFQNPPMVVATPFDSEKTAAGQDTSVVITSVTNTNASFIVRYNTAGVTNTKINVLAIGKAPLIGTSN
jgi:hypothetical protein